VLKLIEQIWLEMQEKEEIQIMMLKIYKNPN